MGIKTINEMMTIPQMVPTAMSLLLSVFMSYTQNDMTKKGRYPIRKINQGALAFHQGYSQVNAPAALRSTSIITQKIEPTIAKNQRLGMPRIFIFFGIFTLQPPYS